MAFDEQWTERIRAELDGVKGVVEKRMFAAETDAALKEKHTRIFDITVDP